jgi:hypothetical protein
MFIPVTGQIRAGGLALQDYVARATRTAGPDTATYYEIEAPTLINEAISHIASYLAALSGS